MPFKPVENPKCPKCGKSVYAAEERVAGGLKWHKMCFKCGLCSKLLDSTNCSEHEGELYCKVCHARKFGPKGYGFGGGAGCLSMDTGAHLAGELNNHYSQAVLETKSHAQAPEGEGCPRCGGFVYAAEQMLARGRPWHKSCFKCGECAKRLDSVNCCEGPDKDIYCKVCYGKKFGPKGYGYGQGGGALQSDCYANGDSAPKTTVIDTAAIQAKPGQGCPRCGGVVYAAEQVLAKGREWHRKCFKCRDCTKTLDSIIACDGPNKEVYCKTCYGKKWGPHGYGFACGSGFLQTDGLTEDEISSSRPFYNPDTTSIKAPEGQGCPRCGGMVFAAEQQLAKGTMWHKKCFNCAECHRPLDSMLACDGPDKEIHCKACYGKLFGPKGFGYGHAPTLISTNGESTALYEGPKTTVLDTAIIKAESGQGCPRCGGAVFAAELVLTKGREWHRKCFKCRNCTKTLDSVLACDGPDKDVYCKTCYGKKWGPQGFGFAGGRGFLQCEQYAEGEPIPKPFINPDTTSIKAAEGEGCLRCGGVVFAAEQQMSKGRVWHQKCFNCFECRRPLDSMLANDGPDKEIHCKLCYAKLFGPKGFGYGHAPTLVSSDDIEPSDTSDAAPKTTVVDTTVFKAEPGQGCPRCGGAVFAAEQVLSKGRMWHIKCFKCRSCTKVLDSVLACDGPDKEVYCKTCYGKRWGPQGFGFAGGRGFLQCEEYAEGEPVPKSFINPDTTSIKADEGQGCPRCGGAVFAAEQVLTKGRMWHIKCFKCRNCTKVLDSVLACDGPDKDVYCKTCYGKKWGPQGFGFAGGRGFLQCEEYADGEPIPKPFISPNTTSIKAPEGEGCPRCGGVVFAAEQQLSKGKMWHQRCFNCAECHRPLDSMLACDGPDKEIHCKLCYAKLFGPKGFGFGHAPTLVTTDDIEPADPNDTKPRTTVVDPSIIKAEPGQGCPRCGGAVFAAEQVFSKGQVWHQQCFKCRSCGRVLDSYLACDGPDKDAYCKTCYAKKWGPQGYGFAGGRGFLQTDETGEGEPVSRPFINPNTTSIKAAEGEGCPRCGGSVFAAEQILSKGRMWHQKCFHCAECHRPLDSMSACDGVDKEIHCKLCYGKKFGPRGFGFGHAPTLVTTYGILSTEVPSDAPKLILDTAIIKAEPGQGCPRCGGAVFAAEQILSKGRVWHQKCFKCHKCARVLDSYLACDGPDKDVYCKTCYAKKWGPQGYGFAGGKGFLQSDETGDGDPSNVPRAFIDPDTKTIQAPEGQGCPRCGGVVFAAEQQMSKGTLWHQRCFNCAKCQRPLDSMLACDGPDKEIYCKLCYAKKFGPKGFGYGHAPTLVANNGISAEERGDVPLKPVPGTEAIQAPEGQGCPRCGGMVFAAERILAKGRAWHQKCYKCRDCTKNLDSVVVCDGPDKDVYCKTCYGKKWGPQGYGFAGGRGFLQSEGTADGEPILKPFITPDTTSIKAPAGEGCPRCGGMVYAAEQQLSKGKMWHRKCFTCADCHRPLDSMSLCDGPDNEIHCSACYLKMFGSKGISSIRAVAQAEETIKAEIIENVQEEQLSVTERIAQLQQNVEEDKLKSVTERIAQRVEDEQLKGVTERVAQLQENLGETQIQKAEFEKVQQTQQMQIQEYEESGHIEKSREFRQESKHFEKTEQFSESHHTEHVEHSQHIQRTQHTEHVQVTQRIQMTQQVGGIQQIEETYVVSEPEEEEVVVIKQIKQSEEAEETESSQQSPIREESVEVEESQQSEVTDSENVEEEEEEEEDQD